jgi:hypothetical protein
MSEFKKLLQNIETDRAHARKMAAAVSAANSNSYTPGVTKPVRPGGVSDASGLRDKMDSIAGGVAELYQSDPKDLVEQLSDADPFLLFPVKIETKFKKQEDGSTELWVRIFPDDIAIHTHEELLTEFEYTSGTGFWSVCLGAADEIKQAAWNNLVAISGANRSAWIIKAAMPDNYSTAANKEELNFVPPAVYKTGSWTQAPHSRIMPDKFVVTAYAGGRPVYEKTGKLVPDDLQMGPDPSSPEKQLSRDAVTGEIITHEKLAWMFDFETAEDNGMAVRIPLSAPYNMEGFDRIVVLGLRLSADSITGSELVSGLVENHHYSENGFSLLLQGTPTNNTEDTESGYGGTDFSNSTSYALETGPALFTSTTVATEKTDGQLLADALAMNYDALYHIRNSNATDVQEAGMMNKVLWPGTLGYFMGEMMHPVFSETEIEFTRSFFTNYVSGRGPLPAIRVGNQPYGILPVSAFPKWKWSDAEVGKNSSYYTALYNTLNTLQQSWNSMSADVSYAGKTGDPFQLLLTIMGLQAGSVAFYQRLCTDDEYTWNYLNYQNRSIALQWLNSFTQQSAETIAETGFTFEEEPRIASVSFMGSHNELTGALVDDHKELSETDSLSTYDGTSNYIQWLITSDAATITDQSFSNADGAAVAAPKALLYLALRNAYLQQVWLNVDSLLRQKEITNDAVREMSLVNINAEPALTKMDYLFTDAQKLFPESVSTSIAAADLLMQPAGISLLGNSYLLEMKTALSGLASLPTARLERLFTEHLDTCSYRLDAWQTALFTQRLDYLRTNDSDEELQKGTFIGAYGWLEDIRPDSGRKTEVNISMVPEKLHETGKGKIYEDSENGGYIHGFSLNHALTGAVLRNAYLAHADDSHAETMSVNLSSERVRKALYYMDGIRNGQSLSSLLGYQFERALHDIGGGLELDIYIYAAREKFPLISSELDGGDSTETIAANNVVDGYALLDAYNKQTYPYAITGFPVNGSPEANAITAILANLADAMDSIGDLALGESVYQIVQGNYERGGAALKSISEAKEPFNPQIADTPRKGAAITNRIMLNLETDTADNPWGGMLSPAATAEKGLNKWLATFIPDPSLVKCIVDATYTDGETGEEILVTADVSLSDLGLQPVDLVLISDKTFGTGSSELEKRIVYHFKKTNTELTDAIPATIRFRDRREGWDTTITGFFELMPLVTNLRSIIMQCRASHALDLQLPAGAQLTTNNNRKGYDTADLTNGSNNGRLDITYTALAQAKTDLSVAATAAATSYTAELFNAWRDALFAVAGFGIAEAVPRSFTGYSTTEYDILAAQTTTIEAMISERLAAARVLLDTPASTSTFSADATETEIMLDESMKVEELITSYTKAAQLLLGASFNLLPRYRLENSTEVQSALTNSTNLVRYATDDMGIPFIAAEWLQGVAKVRKRAADLDEAIMYTQNLFDVDATLTPIQLPYDATHHWVAVEFPETMKIDQDMVSITCMQPEVYDPAELQCGILLDEWTELVPDKQETTGIAFHYDQPNAMPPQALLLAVTPEIKGNWTWQDLMDILNDTLDRAKTRAVEPDQIDNSAYAQFLPALLTAFSSSPVTISTYWAQNITGNLITKTIAN